MVRLGRMSEVIGVHTSGSIRDKVAQKTPRLVTLELRQFIKEGTRSSALEWHLSIDGRCHFTSGDPTHFYYFVVKNIFTFIMASYDKFK